ALSEKNETKRKNLYGELYKELSDDLPYIFLFEKMNMDVYSSKVKGMENISLYRWFTKDLEKLYFE
ncbi:MAG TPA: peptide ABC transporter substrate-binding protein, partial [Candidatus Dwaynia gallinarum]|nr:peptide ABC transporter substrate-binding protein [Candidatus Dwaynia gallinarum]